MGHNRDKDQDTWNMYERVNMATTNVYYRNKTEGGEWKDPSVTEVKGTFKWYLLVIAAGMLVGTVVNFNYLGGIPGIMELFATMSEKAWWENDYVGLLGMVIMPALAGLCLYLAFKKKKRHYVESE